MVLKVLPASANRFRLHPVEASHAPIFCFALLTISCALAGFALACATPFAAFAVILQQLCRFAVVRSRAEIKTRTITPRPLSRKQPLSLRCPAPSKWR
jgi:hypothetical protein